MAGESYSKNWLTPKNILLYLVVGGVLYGLIYYVFLAKKGSSLYEPPSLAMEVVLNEQNNSGESGIAMLNEFGGKTTVSLTVNNAPESGEQPAHIRTGACPSPGAVTYPLTNLVNGSSVTVLDR